MSEHPSRHQEFETGEPGVRIIKDLHFDASSLSPHLSQGFKELIEQAKYEKNDGILEGAVHYFQLEEQDKEKIRQNSEIVLLLSGGIGDVLEQTRLVPALLAGFPNKNIRVICGGYPKDVLEFPESDRVVLQDSYQALSDLAPTICFLERTKGNQLQTILSRPDIDPLGVPRLGGRRPLNDELEQILTEAKIQKEDFDPGARLSSLAKQITMPNAHQVQEMYFALSRITDELLDPQEFLDQTGVRIPEFVEDKEFDVVIFYDSKTGNGVKNFSAEQLEESIHHLLSENPNLRIGIAWGISYPETAAHLSKVFPQLTFIKEKSFYKVIERGVSAKTVLTVDSASAHYLGIIRRAWLQQHSREEVFELIEVMGLEPEFEIGEYHADMVSELIVADKKASDVSAGLLSARVSSYIV